MKEREIKKGMILLGMKDWYFNQTIKGKVLNTELSDFDPIHPIVLSTDLKAKFEINSTDDYLDIQRENPNTISIVSGNYFKEYSEKDEKILSKILKMLSIHSEYDREGILNKFFNEKFKIRSFKFKKGLIGVLFFIRKLISHIFIGTLELLFYEYVKFYKNRNKIVNLKKELKDKERSIYLSELSSNQYNDERKEYKEKLEKEHLNIKGEIEKIENYKIETSRSFLAFLIAIVSLIIAISG